jgi:hypothetical protein
VTTTTASSQIAGTRYEALIDPVAQTITVSPVGMHTQAAGVWVRSANAVWSAPVFSFDLLVTNNSGASLSTVRGVVLSTTPGSPTVQPTGTNGTLGSGLPYYDYGTIANGATGTANWKFSIPSVTPFRFGFTIQQGAGTDAGPQKNQAPVSVSLSPANPNLVAGGSTTITATASDPNADSLTYSWSAPSGGSISGSGATITYTAPGATGTYPVNVTVDDGKGGTATGTTSLSVGAGGGNGTAQGNASYGAIPAAAVKRVTLSPATATIDPGEWLNITATGLDNPGNAVATDWTWSQTGSQSRVTSGPNPLWRGTFDQGTAGNVASWRTDSRHTKAGNVTVTARSANNQMASMTITVREKPPIIQSFSPAANVSVNSGVAKAFNITCSDPNGNLSSGPSASVTNIAAAPGYGHNIPGYSIPIDYVAGTRTATITATFFGPGSTCQLQVTCGDSAGNTATHTWFVTVI